jgi:UDP:flavonoid glycosyltransferase YjiC (YdhE family)
LLLPRHLEQGLNARNLKRINVVHLIDPKNETSIRRSIASFLEDRNIQAASMTIAEQLAAREPTACLKRLAQTVDSFIR